MFFLSLFFKQTMNEFISILYLEMTMRTNEEFTIQFMKSSLILCSKIEKFLFMYIEHYLLLVILRSKKKKQNKSIFNFIGCTECDDLNSFTQNCFHFILISLCKVYLFILIQSMIHVWF